MQKQSFKNNVFFQVQCLIVKQKVGKKSTDEISWKCIFVLCVTDHSFKSSQLHLWKPPIFHLTMGLKSSWLKSPGLKDLGLKLGVEKSGVEMSFNHLKDLTVDFGNYCAESMFSANLSWSCREILLSTQRGFFLKRVLIITLRFSLHKSVYFIFFWPNAWGFTVFLRSQK